jgi:hypothetical protein
MDKKTISTISAIHETAKQYKVESDSLLQKDLESLDSNVKKQLEHLAEFFDSSIEEARTIALLVNDYFENDAASVRTIIDMMHKDYSYSVELNNYLKIFWNRGLIYPNANPSYYPLTKYGLSGRLIKAILEDDKNLLIEEPVSSLTDLLNRFGNKMNHRKKQILSSKDLYQDILDLHRSVGVKLPLSEFILSNKVGGFDAALLTFICYRSLESNSATIDLTDFIDSLELPYEERIYLRNLFKSKTHLLYRLKLIKPHMSSVFFSEFEFELTQKGYSLFESENSVFEEEYSIDELLDKINEHGIEKIPERYIKMLQKLSSKD